MANAVTDPLLSFPFQAPENTYVDTKVSGVLKGLSCVPILGVFALPFVGAAIKNIHLELSANPQLDADRVKLLVDHAMDYQACIIVQMVAVMVGLVALAVIGVMTGAIPLALAAWPIFACYGVGFAAPAAIFSLAIAEIVQYKKLLDDLEAKEAQHSSRNVNDPMPNYRINSDRLLTHRPSDQQCENYITENER